MCGIAGVFGHPEAANLVYLMLYALQHRGQESAGIASSNREKISCYKKMGLVREIFNREVLRNLKGDIAIGHNRYSTTGASIYRNAQPILANLEKGSIAIVHNGNITNSLELRKELQNKGAIFQSTTDSEILLHLVARSKQNNLQDKVIEGLSRLKGSYSLLLMSTNKIIAARDPFGFRPLLLGTIEGSYVLASESCAFDLIGAEYIRDIEPGEVVLIEKDTLYSFFPFPRPNNLAQCIFELIYFARPDSIIFGGENVYEFRKNLGVELAKNDLVEADFVTPVPDSSNAIALGYAYARKIPFEFGIIRNHYIWRTFIEPRQRIRDFGAKIKLNPVKHLIKGKRVIIVDDSIVRGTIATKIVRMLREAGAKEVHYRIGSPPIIGSCYFGIDTPTTQELIANIFTPEEICKKIGAETLKYQTLQGLYSVLGENKENYCFACFTGNFTGNCPIPRQD